MRKRRVAFFTPALLSLVLLLYSGDAIWLWVLMFQSVVLLLGLINILLTFHFLSFGQVVVDSTVTAGGKTELKIRIHNVSPLPYSHLTVEFHTVVGTIVGQAARYFAAITPGRTVEHSFSMNCPYRGEYTVGVTAVEAVDLFGLIRMRRPAERFAGVGRPSPVVVFPRIYEHDGSPISNHQDDASSGESRVAAEELSQIADIRGYRQGDPLKRIHWKLSARMRELLVKEFDGSTSSQNVVLLDCSQHGLSGEAAAKHEDILCGMAAGYARMFCEGHHPVRLVTYGQERVEIDGGTPREFESIYYHLARVSFGGNLPLADALKLETGPQTDSLIVVTGTPTAELFEGLCAAADGGCRISLALNPTGVDGDMENRSVLSRLVDELAQRGVEVILPTGGGTDG